MKPSQIVFFLLSIVSAASALAVFGSQPDEINDLVKRKGGGGGGGRGGGSSGGSKSGGGSGGSRGGGSSSSGSGSSSSSGSGGSKSGSSSSSSGGKGPSSSSSNTGGKTSTGSGVTPRFGGGKYYGGGATVPYSSGKRGPSGILPIAILGGGLLFWSGLWLAGAHAYHYTHPYTFHNYTSDPEQDQTLNVTCICQPRVECGCDDSGDYAWLDDIIGNGSYAALNHSLIFVGEVNGTRGIYINGTLPNGTTAAGGAAHLGGMISAVGFWPVALAVGAVAFL